ncbi:MAG: hypothetical protein ABIK72_07450 [candidate division WOR-3 bacterium]
MKKQYLILLIVLIIIIFFAFTLFKPEKRKEKIITHRKEGILKEIIAGLKMTLGGNV